MQISYIALYPFGTAAGGNKMKKTNTQKENKSIEYTIIKDINNIKIDNDVSINID